MNVYAKKIKAYWEQSAKDSGAIEVSSLLDMLWRIYDSDFEALKKEFQPMEQYAKGLSLKRQRRIKNIAAEVCIAHERAAFTEGIRAGVMLILEIIE